MKILFDTSLIIAALVEPHPMHIRAFPWLKKAKTKDFELVVASHTLAESYAVLSTLPIKPRISPSVSWRLINEKFLCHDKNWGMLFPISKNSRSRPIFVAAPLSRDASRR